MPHKLTFGLIGKTESWVFKYKSRWLWNTEQFSMEVYSIYTQNRSMQQVRIQVSGGNTHWNQANSWVCEVLSEYVLLIWVLSCQTLKASDPWKIPKPFLPFGPASRGMAKLSLGVWVRVSQGTVCTKARDCSFILLPWMCAAWNWSPTETSYWDQLPLPLCCI